MFDMIINPWIQAIVVVAILGAFYIAAWRLSHPAMRLISWLRQIMTDGLVQVEVLRERLDTQERDFRFTVAQLTAELAKRTLEAERDRERAEILQHILDRSYARGGVVPSPMKREVCVDLGHEDKTAAVIFDRAVKDMASRPRAYHETIVERLINGQDCLGGLDAEMSERLLKVTAAGLTGKSRPR